MKGEGGRIKFRPASLHPSSFRSRNQFARRDRLFSGRSVTKRETRFDSLFLIHRLSAISATAPVKHGSGEIMRLKRLRRRCERTMAQSLLVNSAGAWEFKNLWVSN